MCCCNKIFRICQPVNTCPGSALHVNYQADPGQYIFQLKFLSALINKDVTIDSDGYVRIDTSDLNENHTYTAQLLRLNGDPVTLIDEGVEYDCVQFSTKLIIGSQINFTDAGNSGTYSYLFLSEGDFEIQLQEGKTLDYVTIGGAPVPVKIGTTAGGGELADQDTDGQPIIVMHQADADKIIYVTGVPVGRMIKIKIS